MKFTLRGQRALDLAYQEAKNLNHNYVGTEHLLLGLIELKEGTAIDALQEAKLDLETIRQEVVKHLGPSPEKAIEGNPPRTPRTKAVLALAEKKAQDEGCDCIGTGHLLSGLLLESKGIAAQVLKSFNFKEIERKNKMSDINVVDLGSEDDATAVVPFNEPSVSPIQGIQGEFGGGDIKFPYFGIIHSVGPNFAKFPKNAGDLLYNGETLVDKPVELSFYGVQKKYVQNLRYEPTGPRPNEFTTTQQVISAGGNLKEFVAAGSDDNNYVSHAVCHIVLFALKGKKASWAEGLDLAIPNGSEYLVPALWTLRGTSYRAIVPQLIMADTRLRKEKKTLAAQRWNLDTKHMKIGSNFVYVPVMEKADKLNSEETLSLLADNFGG